MIALACILLAAASSVQRVVDQVYEIPANEWRYVELGLKQRSPTVEAEFHVQKGSDEVRLLLVDSQDLERMRRKEPHDVLTVTPSNVSGKLLYDIQRPDGYAIVVENRGDAPSTVRLQVSVDFSGRHRSQVTRLSTQRQAVVVLISFAVFFAIVTYSARRLLRAMKR